MTPRPNGRIGLNYWNLYTMNPYVSSWDFPFTYASVALLRIEEMIVCLREEQYYLRGDEHENPLTERAVGVERGEETNKMLLDLNKRVPHWKMMSQVKRFKRVA